MVYNRDLIVVPAYTAKGLEFDSVIIYTDENNKYKKNEKYFQIFGRGFRSLLSARRLR